MQALTFFFAFVVVLALIGVVAWLIRRFASNRLGANTQRGRMPRLAVIDAAAVDGRRRLVLVRRDNVEHLLMIGGPTDIVVEPNIVRAAPGRDQLPPRPAVASPDMQPRIVPLPDAAGWGDNEAARAEPFDHAEPQMPEPPPRPARPAFADEARRPVRAERPADPLAGFTAEPLGGRPEPVMPPAPPRMPRGETMPRSEPIMPRPARPTVVETPKAPPREPRPVTPPAPPPVPPMASADQNLAEMAQRLEAALRRPAGEAVAPPVAPEPPAARPVPRSEQPPPAPAGPSPKSGFDNLEDEMASLLGRPKNPS
ncbi:MAG TPA: flagellar biosynthetic protein FliO [Bradyrhizobium sp.]|uniref:flagellar biosynthetic protein FliO n=1 Tax=Bradyrhizobium sp. TaxID=376 RepID=UPI002D7E7566|nr:flagellar biosynthetic protein FliO [Bradyrhizobium sp.]HET7888636.1 flagellar biosynthetic protein FliO [Bradyrhizobium sp.]